MFWKKREKQDRDASAPGDRKEAVSRLADALRSADAVVLGAGAGLSAAAGSTYSGPRFEKWFRDFEERYGFHDMYSGGFYPYEDPEERWGFWCRNIFVNRYLDPPGPVYARLLDLIRDRDYFVLTTNVDHCFQRAGFDKKRLFYTQGDYGLFQCSLPCRQETWDNEAAVREMLDRQEGVRIPSELVPRCPWCGRPAATNLRTDDTFVEDAGWHAAADRYTAFLQEREGRSILFWELGVGYNTPGIIKYPFWRMTYQEPNAVYACVDLGDVSVPKEIADRSIRIRGDIREVLEELASEMQTGRAG